MVFCSVNDLVRDLNWSLASFKKAPKQALLWDLELKIEQIIDYVLNKHPLKALDIFEHVSTDILRIAKPMIQASTFDEASLSSARREILEKIQQL